MSKQKEKEIENHILKVLRMRGIFAWKVKSMGTFDTKRGVFRAPSPLYMKGVSDILGCLEGGRFLAIEVKSEKGKLTPEQRTFLERVHELGGVAMVARSVDDVMQKLFTRESA